MWYIGVYRTGTRPRLQRTQTDATAPMTLTSMWIPPSLRIAQMWHGRDLIEEQKQAFIRITSEFVCRPDEVREMKLAGYAGTGKTFVLGRIVKTLRGAGYSVLGAAPTNRAAEEVSRSIGGEAATIHRLLGLQVQRDGEGGYRAVQVGDTKIPDGSIVVVDEASMVCADVHRAARACGDAVRWLWVGDPGQLPPVGERESGVFSCDGATLTRVVRQAESNPILDLATRIRNGEAWRDRGVLRYGNGEGIGATSSVQRWLESAARNIEQWGTGVEGTRVLCYTNDRATHFNGVLRKMLRGEAAPAFARGEVLRAHQSWHVAGEQVLRNGECVEVQEATPRQTRFDGTDQDGWTLTVQGTGGGEERRVDVLARECRKAFEKKTTEVKSEAQSASGDERRRLWKRYYDRRERFADLRPNYATTIHKAQGETVRHAYVDLTSILRSGDPKKQQALLYVAVTRPTKNLGLLFP